jgi:hypothetical protein
MVIENKESNLSLSVVELDNLTKLFPRLRPVKKMISDCVENIWLYAPYSLTEKIFVSIFTLIRDISNIIP